MHYYRKIGFGLFIVLGMILILGFSRMSITGDVVINAPTDFLKWHIAESFFSGAAGILLVITGLIGVILTSKKE
jgi:uncharacterized protein (DUF3820 family)